MKVSSGTGFNLLRRTDGKCPCYCCSVTGKCSWLVPICSRPICSAQCQRVGGLTRGLGSAHPQYLRTGMGDPMNNVHAQLLSRVRLFVTLWTVARQAPLPMGFFRLEYWSGLPRPPPGDLPNPVIEPMSLTSALTEKFFTPSTTWEAPHHALL